MLLSHSVLIQLPISGTLFTVSILSLLLKNPNISSMFIYTLSNFSCIQATLPKIKCYLGAGGIFRICLYLAITLYV